MTRTNALIFIFLLSITIIASFYYIEYSEQQAFDSKKALHSTQKILSDFLMLRRYEKDYLSRHHPSYLENHKLQASQLRQELELLSTSSKSFESRQLKINKIQNDLNLYLETFSEIEAILSKMGTSPHQGLYGELRKNAHQLEHILSEQKKQSGLNLLLLMRKTEKDFMLHPAQIQIDYFEAQLTGLQNYISATEMPQHEKTKLQDYLKNYQETFLNYAQFSLRKGGNEHDGFLGDLRKHAKNFETDISTLKQEIVKDSINTEYKAYSQARVLSLAFPLLVILLALVPFALNINKKEKEKLLKP